MKYLKLKIYCAFLSLNSKQSYLCSCSIPVYHRTSKPLFVIHIKTCSEHSFPTPYYIQVLCKTWLFKKAVEATDIAREH